MIVRKQNNTFLNTIGRSFQVLIFLCATMIVLQVMYPFIKLNTSYPQGADIQTNTDNHEDSVCHRPKSMYRYDLTSSNKSEQIVYTDSDRNESMKSTFQILSQKPKINELQKINDVAHNTLATPRKALTMNKFETNVYLPQSLRNRASNCVTNSVSVFQIIVCLVVIFYLSHQLIQVNRFLSKNRNARCCSYDQHDDRVTL